MSEKIEDTFELCVKNWIEYIESVTKTLKDIRSKNCLNCDDYKNGIRSTLYAGVGGLTSDNNCPNCIRRPRELLHFLSGSDHHKSKKQKQLKSEENGR